MTADRRRESLIALLVFVVAYCVFIPSHSNQFLYFDDEVCVTTNPPIQAGLTWSSIRWAFTSDQCANWFPLTRLSHMLDMDLFGDDPRGHHATSVLLHALNSALVFLVLARMTAARAAAFAAALIFAVHPLHVESVAWVSSRKDVLSGLFWLLAMWAYLAYVKAPTRSRYVLVATLFVCAFMSKPVAVTLPFALLLLDYWPLARMQRGGGRVGRREAIALVVEKIPLFALAALFSAITYLVQRSGGVMNQIEGLNLVARINNAFVAYAEYVSHTFVPAGLMFPYAHAGADRPLWHGALAGALLLLVTAIAFLLRRRAPSLLVGWLWYLGTLVPTIGLIQVGSQSMADRYMYLPVLGLIVAVVWPVTAFTRRRALRMPIDAASIRMGPDRVSFLVLSVAVMIALIAAAWNQQRVWHDSESLLRHAVEVEPENVPARVQLAVIFLRQHEPENAETLLNGTIVLDGRSVPAWSNLGSALRMQGRAGEAINAFRFALELDPNQYAPALNLGSLYFELNRPAEGFAVMERAIQSPDETGDGYLLLIQCLSNAQMYDDALRIAAEAVNRFPGNESLLWTFRRLRDGPI